MGAKCAGWIDGHKANFGAIMDLSPHAAQDIHQQNTEVILCFNVYIIFVRVFLIARGFGMRY